MELIPALTPIIATCGVVAGVYTPFSLSVFSNNTVTSEQQQTVQVQTHSQTQTVASNSQDYKKLSYEEPILACEQYGKSYKVYLVTTGGGNQDWKKESSVNQITFKFVDTKNGDKVVWGPESNIEGKWTNWTLRFGVGGEVKLGIPDQGDSYNRLLYSTIECQTKMIGKIENDAGREVTMAAVKDHTTTNEIKLEVDTQTCSPKSNDSGKEECDIKFASGVNLKWEGITPKAIFQTASQE